MATRSPAQPPEEVYALQIRAEVLRTLSQANEVRRGHSDRLLLGSGDDPVERSVDTVAGSETVTIAGDLSETTGGSRSNSSSRQDFNIDGKLTLRGREETNILHGNMREMHHGRELLLSGMSDDMVGGLGIRTTAPVDLWLSALTGIEEKLGTAAADGALVEIAGMHMEREYGKGVHAYGAGVWTGAFYTHTATGFRPLLKMVRGVRNMTPGGGSGGGGSAAAAPPPAGAPPVATVPPFKFLKGVGKLGTNATPGDLIRLADLGEDARELQEVENARQMPGADVLKRVDDVAPDDTRGVILLDDGTGTLAAHAADGADFDDPDWMRHLGGDAPPADDGARGADVPDDFGNPSHLSAEVDRIRAAELAPLLDPATRSDRAAQSIADRIRTLQQTGGARQEKIRQYSLALALVKEGRNPVGVLDDVAAASDVSSILRYATPPTFADEIRPVVVRPAGADDTGGEAFRPWADLIERREQADRFYQHKPETTGAKPSGLQLMGENHLQTTRIELRNMLEDLVRPLADDLGLDDARLTAMDTNMRGSDTALNLRQELVRAISEAKADSTDLNRVVIENGVVQINSGSFIRWEPIEDASNIEAMQRMLDNWDAFATTQIAEAIEHADELADWDGIRLADNLDQGAFIDELRRLQAQELAKFPEDVGSIPVDEVNAINAAVTTYGRAIGNAEAGYDPVPYIVETETWVKTFGGDGGLDKATAARVNADVRRAIVEALDNPAFKTAPDVAPTNQRAILTQAQIDAFHAGDFDQAWDLQKQIDEFDAQYRASVESDYADAGRVGDSVVDAANPATEFGNDEVFEPWGDLIQGRERADLDYQRSATATGANQAALHLIRYDHLQITRIDLRNTLEEMVLAHADDLGLSRVDITSMDNNARGSDAALNLRQQYIRAIDQARNSGNVDQAIAMQHSLNGWETHARAQIAAALSRGEELANFDGIRLADNVDQNALVDELRRLQMQAMDSLPPDPTLDPAGTTKATDSANAYAVAVQNAEAGLDPTPYLLELQYRATYFGGDGLNNTTAADTYADVRRSIAELLDDPAYKTSPDVDPPNQRASLANARTAAFHTEEFDMAWELQKQLDQFDEALEAQRRAGVENAEADALRQSNVPSAPSSPAASRAPVTWPQSFDPNGADTPTAGTAAPAVPEADLFNNPTYAPPPAAKPDLFDDPVNARIGLDTEVPPAAPAPIRVTGADEVHSGVLSDPDIVDTGGHAFTADTGSRKQIQHDFHADAIDAQGTQPAANPRGTLLTRIQRKVRRWFGNALKPAADRFDLSYGEIHRWEPPKPRETSFRPRLKDDGAFRLPDEVGRPFEVDVEVHVYDDVEAAGGTLAPTDPEADAVRAQDTESAASPHGTPRTRMQGEEQRWSGNASKPAADRFDLSYGEIHRWEPPKPRETSFRPRLKDDGASWLPDGPFEVEVEVHVYDDVEPSRATGDLATPQATTAAAETDAIAEGGASRRQHALTHWASTSGLLEDASARPVELSELTQSMPSLPGSSVDVAPPPARADSTRIPLPGEEGFGESSGRFLGTGAGEADSTALHRMDIANPAGELSPRPSSLDDRYSSVDDLDGRHYPSADELQITAAIEPEAGSARATLPFDESIYEVLPSANVVPAREDPSIRMVQSLNDVRRPFEPTDGAALDEALGTWMDDAATADGSDVRRANPADSPHRFSESPTPTRQTPPPPPAPRDPQGAWVDAGRKPIDLPFAERPINPRGDDTLPQRVAERIYQQGSSNAFGSFVLRNRLEDLIAQGRLPTLPPDDAEWLAQRIGEKINSLWVTQGSTAAGIEQYFRPLVLVQEGVDPTDFITNLPGNVQADIARWKQRPPPLPPEVDATRMAQRIADRIDNLRHTTGTTPEKIGQYNLALSLVQEGLDPSNIVTDLDAKSDMRYFLRPPAVPRAERPPRIPAVMNRPEFKQRFLNDLHVSGWIPLPDDVDTDLAVRKIADRIEIIESTFDASRIPHMSHTEMQLAFDQQAEKVWQYSNAMALVNTGLDPMMYEGGWTTAIEADLRDILRQSSRGRNA